MAIQPIDLQTLFTQIDKVGKAQSAQREGAAVQQAIQGVQIQKKTEERIKEVSETQDTGDGSEKVNDRGQRHARRHAERHAERDAAQKEKAAARDEENKQEDAEVFRDPSLGRNIDISL